LQERGGNPSVPERDRHAVLDAGYRGRGDHGGAVGCRAQSDPGKVQWRFSVRVLCQPLARTAQRVRQKPGIPKPVPRPRERREQKFQREKSRRDA